MKKQLSALMLSFAIIGGITPNVYADEYHVITREDADRFGEAVRDSIQNLPPDTHFDGLEVQSAEPLSLEPVNPTSEDGPSEGAFQGENGGGESDGGGK